MYDHYLRYLEREHARLEAEIRDEQRRPRPCDEQLRRLKKLKLAVRDQMAVFGGLEPRDGRTRNAARSLTNEDVDCFTHGVPPAALASEGRGQAISAR